MFPQGFFQALLYSNANAMIGNIIIYRAIKCKFRNECNTEEKKKKTNDLDDNF